MTVFVKKENASEQAGATFLEAPEVPKTEISICWRFYEEKLSGGNFFSSYLSEGDEDYPHSKYGSVLFLFSNWKYNRKIAKNRLDVMVSIP